MREIKKLKSLDPDELFTYAKEIQAPYELVKQTAELGRLPVVNFAAGGVATPADACLMMQLGMDGVFVGSGCAPPIPAPWRGPSSQAATDRPRRPLALAVSSSRPTRSAVRAPSSRRSPTTTTRP